MAQTIYELLRARLERDVDDEARDGYRTDLVALMLDTPPEELAETVADYLMNEETAMGLDNGPTIQQLLVAALATVDWEALLNDLSAMLAGISSWAHDSLQYRDVSFSMMVRFRVETKRSGV